MGGRPKTDLSRHPFPETGEPEAQFRWFAANVADEAPVYAHLAARIVQDPELLSLASDRLPGQPAPNMLFASVRYLIERSDHGSPLRVALESGSLDKTLWESFREFCLEHRRAIGDLVATRRTQTNEVGRAAGLLPMLALTQWATSTPLGLIEIGTSAGLLLRLDRYYYRYSSGHEWGSPNSPVRLEIETRREAPPLPDDDLVIGRRVGIDLNPIDPNDEDAVAWLRALLWPGQDDRRRRLEGAVELARLEPADVIAGDALEHLAGVIADVGETTAPVVFHSFALVQWSPDQRRALDDLLQGVDGRVHRLWFEWFSSDNQSDPELRWFEYDSGQVTERLVGRMHYHGRWLEWLGAG